MRLFAAPPDIKTEVFTLLPDAMRIEGKHSAWTRARGGAPLHSFLEGPAFDRAGRLHCVDVAHGRIFRIADDGTWQVLAEYDGNPNGLKIHRDGQIYVADHKLGLLRFDPETGARTLLADGFRGLNDLVFANNGDLYLTDPGESGLEDLHGRVFRRRPDGTLDMLMDGLPYPNGLVLNPSEDVLYVGVSRSLQVLRLPLFGDRVRKAGVFQQLSGGLGGPDGMAVCDDGSLLVVHAGFGTVWMFDPLGEPLARIRSNAGIRTTNVAFHPVDRSLLFVTEAEQGAILRVRLDRPGRVMYSHRD
ncbi:MAG: SMP-30/gluconolactonase/LRE family protein [Casimicrobiaceae bacterium]